AQVFYALGDRRVPLVVSLVVVAANAAAGFVALHMGAGIAALAAVLAGANVLQALLLVVALRVKLGPLGFVGVAGAALGKLVVACIAGAAAFGVATFGVWGDGATARNVVVLAASIGAAVVVYVVGAVVAKFEGVDVVTRRFLKRGRR